MNMQKSRANTKALKENDTNAASGNKGLQVSGGADLSHFTYNYGPDDKRTSEFNPSPNPKTLTVNCTC